MSILPFSSASRCANTLSNCNPLCLSTILLNEIEEPQPVLVVHEPVVEHAQDSRAPTTGRRSGTSFGGAPTMDTPCHTLDMSRMLYV